MKAYKEVLLASTVRFRLADLMDQHREELATIESLDSGAVYTLALKTHIGMSIDTFRYFAGWCDKIQVCPLVSLQIVFYSYRIVHCILNYTTLGKLPCSNVRTIYWTNLRKLLMKQLFIDSFYC